MIHKFHIINSSNISSNTNSTNLFRRVFIIFFQLYVFWKIRYPLLANEGDLFALPTKLTWQRILFSLQDHIWRRSYSNFLHRSLLAPAWSRLHLPRIRVQGHSGKLFSNELWARRSAKMPGSFRKTLYRKRSFEHLARDRTWVCGLHERFADRQTGRPSRGGSGKCHSPSLSASGLRRGGARQIFSTCPGCQ